MHTRGGRRRARGSPDGDAISRANGRERCANNQLRITSVRVVPLPPEEREWRLSELARILLEIEEHKLKTTGLDR